MIKPTAYVVSGLGIGCHEEAAHAYRLGGAQAEIVHIRQLLSGDKKLFDSQILNLSGGFWHGDMMGAGMCAANEIDHAAIGSEKFKDMLLGFVEKGRIVYGQCNGYQTLVKLGLLPGMNGDYSKQTVTLTHNECGEYRVAPVLHKVVEHQGQKHFAFEGLNDFYIWCRHGEGKLQFHSEDGLISKAKGEKNRKIVNVRHVLLSYADPTRLFNPATEEFPHNPNGSVDGIAGLFAEDENVFGHMGHTEVGVYISRDPRFFKWKDEWRRKGIDMEDLSPEKLEGKCLKVFKNIVARME
ncbi:MAG: phosphoribosylformylglycinamidine synthase subunit PurQ [Nanoarchaeota archaeon]|nr:phosphoribosylformylglycinamidine synthase subunit PurQ [Nanoarchaeota archaeon]